jgi:hypothetical protein
MSLESFPNPTEKLEIMPSAEQDLEAFEDFIKDPKIRGLPDDQISEYIYENFCVKSGDSDKLPSKGVRRRFVRSMVSVEEDLNDIDGVRIEENYNGWLGCEINGGYDKDGSLRRLYLNTKVEYTPDVFKNLVEGLQKNGFHCDIKTFKGDDERDFLRVDKMVIYFNGTQDSEIRYTMLLFYDATSDKFNTKIPRFSEQLAPGIGLGEEPVFPNKSFSQVRAEILARVFYKYKKSNYDENFDFVKTFQKECPFFQVDSRDPSRNKNFLEN